MSSGAGFTNVQNGSANVTNEAPILLYDPTA